MSIYETFKKDKRSRYFVTLTFSPDCYIETMQKQYAVISRFIEKLRKKSAKLQAVFERDFSRNKVHYHVIIGGISLDDLGVKIVFITAEIARKQSTTKSNHIAPNGVKGKGVRIWQNSV